MATVTVSRKSLRLGKAMQGGKPDWDNLVTLINQLVTLANELKTDHNALLAKLDADAGVTDTNYAALHTTAAADADTLAQSK